MNNRLSYGLFRAIETLSGIRATEHLPRLVESQWFGRGRIEQLQRDRLSRLFHYAREHVAYYRDTLPTKLPDGQSRQPIADGLLEVPLLTKALARDHVEHLQALWRRPMVISTSGSTGTPLTIHVDRQAFARGFAAKLRALGWFGVRFSDRQLRVWGRSSGGLSAIGWSIRDALQNRHRLTTFDLSDAALDRTLKHLDTFRPTYINGYTSGIHRLAQHTIKRGIDSSGWGTRAVLPTSEVLLPQQRSQIEEAFKAPVVNEYGCGEVHAIAYECEHGRLHPTHEHLVLELLDSQGMPVGPGNAGLVTLTGFLNRAMPMIRYQNGDIGEWSSSGDCKCGRHPGLPTLSSITGRSADVLRKTDGSASHWTTLYYAIKESFAPGALDEHQAKQLALNHLLVLYVPGHRFDASALAPFAQRLRKVLGSGLHVEFKEVRHIERSPSGKLKYFLSEVDSGEAC